MNLSNYHLTFDDEFNSFNGWDTTIYGSRSLPGNGGQEFYSDSSVGVSPFTLQNGELTITASPSSNLPSGLSYNSGVITTHGDFSQTYGYFEARIEAPEGAGMWPGFWLLRADQTWPPEIDVLEAFGAPATDGQGGSNMVHVNAITSVGGEGGGEWIGIPGNIYTGYHTYGVDWEADYITYYIDGAAVSQIKTPDDMHSPMFMLANLAVGGTWPGNATGETGQMKIDYMRAYSSDPNTHTVAMQTISSPDGANTAPGATTGSSGNGTIVLHVSEDAFNGDAKFTVAVDGQQVGDIQTATAIHSSGQWQDITINGNFDNGPHTVSVNFLNDAWSASGDRNLYVQSITVNGEHIAGTSAQDFADAGWSPAYDSTAAVLLSTGSAIFTAHGGSTTSTPSSGSSLDSGSSTSSSSTSSSTGSGNNSLTVHVSEDAWNGDAQFTVSVDGQQIGGVQTATATHGWGQWQDITLNGDFSTSTHNVAISFINDAWGGSSSSDRNLYIQSVTINGSQMAGNTASDTAANGAASSDPSSAVMQVNGTATFGGASGSTASSGSSTSTITLHVSEDAWNGNANFIVSVDGQQVGGVETATASHSAGQTQAITLTGDFGLTGPGKIDVTFLNDAYGGSSSADRNLYVQSIDVNDVNFASNTVTANTANSAGWNDASGSVLLAQDGTATFNINHAAPPDHWS
jgi:beta-glucanase (GH16 family)